MSNPLAEAYIHLRADGRKLPGDLDKVKRVAMGSISSLSKTLKSMLGGALGVGLSTAGLVAGMGKAMSLAQQQIDAEKKLGAVLTATGYAAGFQTEELTAQAAALQKVTNFGDETIIAMQAVLATFRNIKGDVFKDATASILDMSAVLGTDLKGGAIQVGKALNDPIQGIAALTRVGITFSDQQKEQIRNFQESGDMMKAQRVILAELGNQFGGAAKAMADPLKQVKNALGDLGEQIGMQLLPYVHLLAADLTDMATGANATGDAVEWVGNAAAIVADVLHTVGTVGRFVWAGLQALFAGLMESLAVISSGMAKLKIIGKETADAFRQLADSYWETAGENYGAAWDSFIGKTPSERAAEAAARRKNQPTPVMPKPEPMASPAADPKKTAERLDIFTKAIGPADQFRQAVEAANMAIAEQRDAWEKTGDAMDFAALAQMEYLKGDVIRAAFEDAFGGAKTPVEELTESLSQLRRVMEGMPDEIPSGKLSAALSGMFDKTFGQVEQSPLEQTRQTVAAFQQARDELTFGAGLELPVDEVNRLLEGLEKRVYGQLGIAAIEGKYKTPDERHEEQMAELEAKRDFLSPEAFESEKVQLDAVRKKENLEREARTADKRSGGFVGMEDLNYKIQEALLGSEEDRIQEEILKADQDAAAELKNIHRLLGDQKPAGAV